ncbi:leucine--tRNA ligase [Candidatus Falkowbacteria bacterium]|nr:MAG: leucine--tRNA ligase [Candidatus Falkowbacteria bacterium]
MEKYNHKKIEKKWAEKWIKDKIFTPDLEKAKNPYYALFMFPYPSAEGLHIGNFYAFTCVDVLAKYKKLQGFDVFEPIGWDAFGIHSENYALKINETPRKMLDRTIVNFRKQLSSAGLGCDWTREVDTTSPEYYRWTQWIFTKLYEKDLAFQKKALLNWCPSCKTVLADEQIEGGVCERCKTTPEKKEMKQWFFKITEYAQRLLDGLETMDWSEITKSAQKNWIGRSEGAAVKFHVILNEAKRNEESRERRDGLKASGSFAGAQDDNVVVEVFTTRPDTLFGATYFVLSPEHPLVKKITTDEQKNKVEKYIREAGARSDLERTEDKEKTGVFTGAYAVNPVNNERIPVWIADYVLMGYGTGAIMAVPAHDERDFEFAQKYELPIKQVAAPLYKATDGMKERARKDAKIVRRNVVYGLVKNLKNNKIMLLKWPEYKTCTFVVGGVKEGENSIEAAKREIIEETGYKNLKFIRQIGDEVHVSYYAMHKNENRYAYAKCFYFELENDDNGGINEEEKSKHEVLWIKENDVDDRLYYENFKYFWDIYKNGKKATAEYGVAINSEFLNNLDTSKAKKKMIEWLEKKGLGKGTVNYKLRDWCISRQRYWGPPVPIIYCEKCGTLPVPAKDLPVILPEMEKDWEPAGDGRGPLAKVKEFMEVKCPKCGGQAEREADVMDNFLDSAWYFFRYISPTAMNQIFDKKLGEKWLPVDLYVGGNEHAVLHLMYTRFITMALRDLGLINFDDPFKRFRANGMILKDGNKMSKSKGNVVNPEEYGEKIGYDALKTYLLFLGPLSDNRSFTDRGARGAKRWVEKIARLEDKVLKDHKDSQAVVKKIHKTIKIVSDDFENQKYNTAIARLMELTTAFSREKNISIDLWKKFLALIAPFTPALAEELWLGLGGKESIFKSKSWPEYDPELAIDEKIKLVIQINGKLRNTIETDAGISEAEAKKLVLESEKVKKWIDGKEIIKVIFVKGKLVNIVIK